MPVKNIKRRTNDGLQGTIVGLTDEEKQALNKDGIASSEDVDNLVKEMPTDVGVKDGKLGLMHGTKWLANQGALNLSGFEYNEATKTLKAKGGVSPCLNLFDIETQTVRTSITEEEKTNLENGLYNSVIYADLSDGDAGIYRIYFPETGAAVEGEGFIFSTYNVMIPKGTNACGITGSSSYHLSIGEKNTDGTYPIAIEKQITASFGTSPRLNLIDTSGSDPAVRTSITEEEARNLVLGLYNSVFYYDVSSPESISSVYFPEPITYSNDNEEKIIFSIFNISVDTATISGSSVYEIKSGSTNADGTIQITIEKLMDVPFAGGGGTAEVITATKTSDQEFEALGLTAIRLAKVPTSSQFILSYDNESILMYKNADGLYSGASFVSIYSAGLSCAFVNVDSSGNAIGAFRKYDLSFLNDMKRENVGKVLTIESTGHAFFKTPESSSSVTIRRW